MIYVNISLDFLLAVITGLVFHSVAPAVIVGVIFILFTLGVLYTYYNYLPAQEGPIESLEITNAFVGFCLSQYQVSPAFGVLGTVGRVLLRLGGYYLALNPVTLILGVSLVGLSYIFYVNEDEDEIEF